METKRNNIPEYTVSEFNELFNETIKIAFDHIKIRGEISNLKKHYSGHLYFSLKDEDSVISSVCWKSNVLNLKIDPEEGMEVIAKGKIATYAKSISVYQLNIENLEIAGEGALLKLIEERKNKLEKQGLFSHENKKSLPYIPRSVGIITSPTGAVIKDIIHRIKERFPLPIQIWPVAVQGKNSAKEIIKAIESFNNPIFKDKPDVIIIARGGGSIEDLMPFNDETLARCVFNSHIPIISAIGHETDTTIIDYVSDLRAPTPSAAAEKCVPVKKEVAEKLSFIVNELTISIKQKLNYEKEMLDKFKRLLHDPSHLLNNLKIRLEYLIKQKNYYINYKMESFLGKLYNLSSCLKNPKEKIKNNYLIVKSLNKSIKSEFSKRLDKNKHNLNNYSRLLENSSIENTLKRGYSIIKKNKKIISNSKQLNKNDIVNIQFHKSNSLAKIEK